MKFVGKDFSPYVLGECPNLGRGAIMVTAQGRQAEWLVGLAHRKVEPSAELSHVLVGRPPAKRQVDDFLLDVDKASISQPLLGDVAVKAQRAPEDIHSIQELLRPLHDMGVPRQGAIVAARIKVYLDLLNIARTWFEVPGKCQQNSSAWCVCGSSPVNFGVQSGPVSDAAIERPDMDQVPGARLKILPR